jgi:hypothetical protein
VRREIQTEFLVVGRKILSSEMKRADYSGRAVERKVYAW